MAYLSAETPIVASLTFNDASPDANILQQRGDVFALDKTIYSYSIKNFENTYWDNIFGGTYLKFNSHRITMTVAGELLQPMNTYAQLLETPNSFLVVESDAVVYVHLKGDDAKSVSNTNARVSVGFAGSQNRLNFVNALLDYKNPSNVTIDDEPAYPILSINDIAKRIDDNVGGIALMNSINFSVTNYQKTPLAFSAISNLQYAVGANLYNSVFEIYSNIDYVNRTSAMRLLFKGFVTDFGYDRNNYNFTIEDFRSTFGSIFCNTFNSNDYNVSAITSYSLDTNDYVPYLFGNMRVELLKIGERKLTEGNGDEKYWSYYIAIDKKCNANPFGSTLRVYDDDGNAVTNITNPDGTSSTISKYNNFILVWYKFTPYTKGTQSGIIRDLKEPKSAFVNGNQTNTALEIIKQMFYFQYGWVIGNDEGWKALVDNDRYLELNRYSPKINLLIEDDKTTKEIITTVCEDDMLFIFNGVGGKITFSHFPGSLINQAKAPIGKKFEEFNAVWFLDYNGIMEYPAISYSSSYDRYTSEMIIKHTRVIDAFSQQHVSVVHRDEAKAYFNKSVNATIESNLADTEDIGIYASNYLRRFNNLSAQATIKLAVPVYNYQLLDLVLCDFKELGIELFINNIFIIIGINYTKNEITVEELPQGNINYYNLILDSSQPKPFGQPQEHYSEDQIKLGTLDTIEWSVDQDL